MHQVLSYPLLNYFVCINSYVDSEFAEYVAKHLFIIGAQSDTNIDYVEAKSGKKYTSNPKPSGKSITVQSRPYKSTNFNGTKKYY